MIGKLFDTVSKFVDGLFSSGYIYYIAGGLLIIFIYFVFFA